MLQLAPIHTERTTIRVVTSTDAPVLAQAVRANAERLAAWMGDAWPAKRSTPTLAQRMIARWTRAARDGTGISCIVERHDDGRGALAGDFAGQVELSHVRGRRSARAGWWLTADAQGRGLMLEALTAFLSICTSPEAGIGIRQITALVNPRNARSISLAERCGFLSAGDVSLDIAGVPIAHRRFVIGR
jgi:RimJ/RimL family protein N-acetyltransferase